MDLSNQYEKLTQKQSDFQTIKNLKKNLLSQKNNDNQSRFFRNGQILEKPYTSQAQLQNINNIQNRYNNTEQEKSFAQRNLFTNQKNNSEPQVIDSIINQNQNQNPNLNTIHNPIQNQLNQFQNPYDKRVKSQQVYGVKQRETKKNISLAQNDISSFNYSQQMEKLQIQQKINYTYKSKAGCTVNRQQKTNQDSSLVNPKVLEDMGFHLFGVFDGHGVNGHLCSQTIKKKLGIHLSKQLQVTKDKTSENIKTCLQKAFLITNKELIESNFDCNLSGSTAIVALLDLQENIIYCANVGDSRAVLARKSNNNQKQQQLSISSQYKSNQYITIPLSEDQKPCNEREKMRILQSGGRICSQRDIYGNPVGPLRVWLKDVDIPGLAMTRSMGDICGAQAGVSSEPEIKQFKIQEDDKFIVLGSDGLFDFIHNNDIVKTVTPFYEKGLLEQGAEKLVNDAVSAWRRESFARDDITCVIVGLPQNLNVQEKQFYLNQDFANGTNTSKNTQKFSQNGKININSYLNDNQQQQQ